MADKIREMIQDQGSGIHRLVNTKGTRMGLKDNSGSCWKEGRDMAYALVKPRVKAVTRA